MKVLSGFAVGLVTFFLVLALEPLSVLLVLNTTVLNPQFVIREIDKLDIVSLAEELLTDQLPVEAQPYKDAISITLEQNEPWIKEQINTTIQESYAYLSKQTDDWSIQIETEALKLRLFDNLLVSFKRSPPEEFSRLSDPEKQLFMDQIREEYMANFPSSIEINQDNIPAEILPQIQKARDAIGLIKTTFYALIAFCLLMIIFTFLIFSDLRRPFRILGTLFLVQGAMGTAVFFITRQMISGLSLPENLPTTLNTWLQIVLKDLTRPWGVLVIGILTVGIVLTVVSFVIPKNNQKLEN